MHNLGACCEGGSRHKESYTLGRGRPRLIDRSAKKWNDGHKSQKGDGRKFSKSTSRLGGGKTVAARQTPSRVRAAHVIYLHVMHVIECRLHHVSQVYLASAAEGLTSCMHIYLYLRVCVCAGIIHQMFNRKKTESHFFLQILRVYFLLELKFMMWLCFTQTHM